MNLLYFILAIGWLVTETESAFSKASKMSLTNEQRHEILNKHNELRRSVRPSASDMLELTWDYNLEEVAQAYAEGCEFEHNDDRHDEYQELGGLGNIGENLAIDTGDSRTIDYFMQTWWDEWMDMESMNSDDWDSTNAGHYSQMAWAETHSIGCGLYDVSSRGSRDTDCDGYERYLVCNYYPFGNLYGNTPYKRGLSCTRCPRSHPFCDNDLCSSYNDTVIEEHSYEEFDLEEEEVLAVPIPAFPTPLSHYSTDSPLPPSPDSSHRSGRCRGHFRGKCAEIRARLEEI